MTLLIDAPGSKSMTQRALLIAALADGDTCVRRPARCDDSHNLSELLRKLGCRLRWDRDGVAIQPGPLLAPAKAIHCGNSGTAVRFGACLSLVCDGTLTIDGDARMRRRPIGPLGECLQRMGVDVRYLMRDGCPPVQLRRRDAPPCAAQIDLSLSSQFASGLLMVAPRLPAGIALELLGAPVSAPYLLMTIAMMRQRGVTVRWEGRRRVVVPPGGYAECRGGSAFEVEPDWSGAAFLLAAAHLSGVKLQVAELVPPQRSLQGDAVFADMLEQLTGDVGEAMHSFDLTDTPDLIAPLAAVALFAHKPTRIRGASHARVKECDRVAVLCRELSRLGAVLREHPDGLDVEPLTMPPRVPITLDPEDDHRMAMAFGLVALRAGDVSVRGPDCVSKSFPHFWRTLDSIRARMVAR